MTYPPSPAWRAWAEKMKERKLKKVKKLAKLEKKNAGYIQANVYNSKLETKMRKLSYAITELEQRVRMFTGTDI